MDFQLLPILHYSSSIYVAPLKKVHYMIDCMTVQCVTEVFFKNILAIVDFHFQSGLFLNLHVNGLVVKALNCQSKGPWFETSGWLQGRLSLSSFRG